MVEPTETRPAGSARLGAALPTVRAAAADPRQVDADVVLVPVFKGGIEGPGAGPMLTALGLTSFPITTDFRGDAGQTLLLAAPGVAAGALLLVGLGRMVDVDPAHLRDAAASGVRAVPRARTVATTLTQLHATGASVQAVAEGLALGAHADPRQNAAARPELADAAVLVPSSRLGEARAALERAAVTAGATAAARELVGAPPADTTPATLAQQLADVAGEECTAEVWDAGELAHRGCGALLAVGGGAGAAPRLLQLRYEPAEPLGHVALVGKGVTFDAGGLSLKSPEHLAAMKADMAGAAVVAAVCGAMAALNVRLAVRAWLPLAENLPSGSACRPGDVVRHPDTTTTEIVDTDAEGQLLLADALALAAAEQPDAIVDVATLTGSASAAVGCSAAAVMGTDDDLLTAVRDSAEAAGERVWPLPLWPELDRFLHSGIADHRQTGDGPHGDPGSDALLAGLYLRRFVGEVPWLHMDTPAAWLADELAAGHLPAGPTGFGVRTLLAWLSP